MATLFRKWDPAILNPAPPHARNNMCVGWRTRDQHCTRQIPMDGVAAGRALIKNLSNIELADIQFSNLRRGLGGSITDCLCDMHKDQFRAVEFKWMGIILVESRRLAKARADRIENWLDNIDPAYGMGPGHN